VELKAEGDPESMGIVQAVNLDKAYGLWSFWALVQLIGSLEDSFNRGEGYMLGSWEGGGARILDFVSILCWTWNLRWRASKWGANSRVYTENKNAPCSHGRINLPHIYWDFVGFGVNYYVVCLPNYIFTGRYFFMYIFWK
jgi:hypothetical protein